MRVCVFYAKVKNCKYMYNASFGTFSKVFTLMGFMTRALL